MEKRARLIENKVLTKTYEGDIILEVELFYDPGNTTAKGKQRKRGYYLLVVPLLLDKKSDESYYRPTCGAVKRVETAERFSVKRLESIEPNQEDIDQLVSHVKNKFIKELKQ